MSEKDKMGFRLYICIVFVVNGAHLKHQATNSSKAN